MKILFGFPNCFIFVEGLDGNLGRFPAKLHEFFEIVGERSQEYMLIGTYHASGVDVTDFYSC